MSHQLIQLLEGIAPRSHFELIPLRPSNVRQRDTEIKGRKARTINCSHTAGDITIQRDLLGRQTKLLFFFFPQLKKELLAGTADTDPLKISLALGLMWGGWVPAPQHSSLSPGTPYQHPALAPVAKYQSRLLELNSTAVLLFGASPSRCAFACSWPDTCHQLPPDKHTWGKTAQPQGSIPASQGPTAICGHVSGPVYYHWPASLPCANDET